MPPSSGLGIEDNVGVQNLVIREGSFPTQEDPRLVMYYSIIEN